MFSLLVEKEDGVQAVQFMEHGSGYRASSKSDAWLVFISLGLVNPILGVR